MREMLRGEDDAPLETIRFVDRDGQITCRNAGNVLRE
jgi:hypothetical protein